MAYPIHTIAEHDTTFLQPTYEGVNTYHWYSISAANLPDHEIQPRFANVDNAKNYILNTLKGIPNRIGEAVNIAYYTAILDQNAAAAAAALKAEADRIAAAAAAQDAAKAAMLLSPTATTAPTITTTPTATTTKPPAAGTPETLYQTLSNGYKIYQAGSQYHLYDPAGNGLGFYSTPQLAAAGAGADSGEIPPNGERYCIDSSHIAVWNSATKKYDTAPCSTGACKDGNCAPPPNPTITTSQPTDCSPLDLICQANKLLSGVGTAAGSAAAAVGSAIGIPKEGDTRVVQCPQDPSKNVNQVYQNGSWVTVSSDANICNTTPTAPSPTPPVTSLEGTTRTKTCPDNDKITITQKYTNGEWVTVDEDKNKCKDNTLRALELVAVIVVVIVLLAILSKRK